MGRKFKDMQTEEQRYAARTNNSGSSRPTGTATPVSHEVWTRMSAYQQAAHLDRLDGKESKAREMERIEKKRNGPAPKKRRGWLF